MNFLITRPSFFKQLHYEKLYKLLLYPNNSHTKMFHSVSYILLVFINHTFKGIQYLLNVS